MSDTSAFGFGQFIPGFDFLQNLKSAGQSAAGIPPLSNWVAPTVSVEEISKRIEELKAVQFWLEQNSRALAATVQALEVQKMTLSTLESMNVSMADFAKTFTASTAKGTATQSSGQESHADWPMSSKAAQTAQSARATAEASNKASSAEQQTTEKTDAPHSEPEAKAHPGMPDPTLWWGALTQQFQQIAASALKDPAQQQMMAQATQMATDFTKAAVNATNTMLRSAQVAGEESNAASKAKGAAPRKTGAKSAASRAPGASTKTGSAKASAQSTARSASAKTSSKNSKK